jgi:hypothetical protein
VKIVRSGLVAAIVTLFWFAADHVAGWMFGGFRHADHGLVFFASVAAAYCALSLPKERTATEEAPM